MDRLEAVQALEEPLDEQCWPEKLARWLDIEVVIWEPWSICTEILALCLLLQSEICRCLQFRKVSTIVSPYVLTVQKSLIKRCYAIFINGSRKLLAMPVFNLVSTLLI